MINDSGLKGEEWQAEVNEFVNDKWESLRPVVGAGAWLKEVMREQEGNKDIEHFERGLTKDSRLILTKF